MAKPNSLKKRERRARLRAQGLCIICGTAPPRDGLATCQPCQQRIRQYQDAHPERQRRLNVKSWHQRRDAVLSHYGRRCACCGEDRYEFLAIDHVNSDGHLSRKTAAFQHAINEGLPDTFQILCHNCNSSKAFHGYCPHQLTG